MKTRTSLFVCTLLVTTCATLILGARSEPLKSNSDPAADVAATEPQTPDKSAPAAQVPAAATSKAAAPAKFSFGVEEVAKMHQNGVDADVIMNYIEHSSVPYHPSADEIVRLHGLGIPPQVITALIRHGAKVQQEAAVAYAQSQQRATEEAKAAAATGTTYATPVVQVAPLAQAPPPVVTYNYSYPQYVYSGYASYYPSFYAGVYSHPRYCYSSPFYRGYWGSPYRGCYSYGHYGYFPHFGFSASFGHSPRFRAGVRF